jgi:8-oxo-dGTP pyrophosphatase MutT (NUDIX family)
VGDVVAISPYLANLRTRLGHDLVLLPAVSVLPADGAGRLLLVRNADNGLWSTIGGSVEPDESPWDAAVREAREEAGVEVALTGIRAVLGGPQFRVRYPSGDECSYVSTVFDAQVLSGEPHPDGEETLDARWFAVAELADVEMDVCNRAIMEATGLVGRQAPQS